MNETSKYRYLEFIGGTYRRFKDSEKLEENNSLIDFGDKMHGSYGALLFDPRWKEKRKEILERDFNKCVVCKSSEKLQIHHRQYHFDGNRQILKNPWEYSNRLLITLCETCHKRGHNQYKVPTIKI